MMIIILVLIIALIAIMMFEMVVTPMSAMMIIEVVAVGLPRRSVVRGLLHDPSQSLH